MVVAIGGMGASLLAAACDSSRPKTGEALGPCSLLHLDWLSPRGLLESLKAAIH